MSLFKLQNMYSCMNRSKYWLTNSITVFFNRSKIAKKIHITSYINEDISHLSQVVIFPSSKPPDSIDRKRHLTSMIVVKQSFQTNFDKQNKPHNYFVSLSTVPTITSCGSVRIYHKFRVRCEKKRTLKPPYRLNTSHQTPLTETVILSSFPVFKKPPYML